MAGATSVAAGSGPSSVLPAAGLVPGLATPAVLSADGLAPELAAQLARVLAAACPGGLSGLTGDQGLAVVEAVEAVKAWADSVSLDATAVLVTELESDFALLARERLTERGWRLYFRSCRSTAAREIQVATGLPVTACQRRVWLSACEPERVGPVREAMRAGRVTLARAMSLVEATRHLDAFTAATIAARVLRALTGPDGAPLPGVAPLSEATFKARLRRQLVVHHGLVGEAERTHAQAVRGCQIVCVRGPS